MSILAIISARGGSKRIPRKNVLPLAGKPMIAWTIESALQAKSLNRVIVSTDDIEIAKVAQQYGAEIPFLRPVELASDTASSVDVVFHLLTWLQKNGESLPTFILLLQPTSPLRTADDINASIALLKEKKANAVVSVCMCVHPISFLKHIGVNGELIPLSVETPAQPTLQLNGAIYLIDTSVFMNEKKFIPDGCYGYIMPQARSLDIDTPYDFHVADLLLKDMYASKYA